MMCNNLRLIAATHIKHTLHTPTCFQYRGTHILCQQ